MQYKKTPARIAAELAFVAAPNKRNLAKLRKAADAEMNEVLAAFDARNKK